MFPLFRSPAEISGWVIAVIIVSIMGVLVFTGPFHKVNKPSAASHFPTLHITIATDPKTTGRYTPKVLRVHLNQAIDFRNVSDAVHTVTANNGAFDSGDIATAGSTSVWHFAPKQTGTFPYYCKYHPLMHGTLIVTS